MGDISEKQHAQQLIQAGQFETAGQLLEGVCRSDPFDAEAHYLLGACNGSLGCYTQAVEALEKSIQLRPDILQTYFALGGALQMLGRFEEAIACFRTVLHLNDQMAAAHVALADVLVIQGAFEAARGHYEAALKLPSGQGAANLGLGLLELKLMEHEKSVPYFQRALQFEQHALPALCGLGDSLRVLGRRSEARTCYLKALHRDPDNVIALGGLALVYEWSGDYCKAFALIEPVVKQGIPCETVGQAFANICKHTGHCKEAVAYVENILRRPEITPLSRQHLHFRIGSVLDHMGEYDAAFAHYKAGNEEIPKIYNPFAHKAWTTNVIKFFDKEKFLHLPKASQKDDLPIFIIGMPRSGTSLVEQILACHTEVYGAGELTYLSDLLMSLPPEPGISQRYPYCLNALGQGDVDRLASRYIDQLRGLSKQARRVTDKMPHNFYFLGMIQQLFPGARVIHCRRDPKDTCLSVYFQDFRDEHTFARNLFNIGTHYHQYQRLMNHWEQTLSIPMLDVCYEELVNNQEEVTRQMLAFCELEWDKNCLLFHQRKRTVETSSYHQVRQPMYNKSIGRWRRYAHYLEPLEEGLNRGY